MSILKDGEIFASRSLGESAILDVPPTSEPSYRDILNAQILLHCSTDEIATELSNRYLVRMTGSDYFNTSFKDIETKYLTIELASRIMTLQKIILTAD